MKIVGATGLVGLWALEWAWQTAFLDQSIGIDSQYILVKMLCLAYKLGGLWALEWAWHICVTNLRCVQGYGI